MNNLNKRYVVSLDSCKACHLVRKVVADVAEKTGYTGTLYDKDKIDIISVLPFHNGTCSVLIAIGSRSSINVYLPSNNDDDNNRDMRVRFYLYSEEWNELLDEELIYDWDEFMNDYLYPFEPIEEKEKED